ncbi:Tim44 domain-containing protein [Thiomicrorhabdus sp. 6S3-12]|uniref:Tim44 domain-containing protein n=1 Tax=Thiomicrorhabdus sp. 6S3-12 TaxID=2819681 RepID=UPI001AAC8880|nr:TIM44-like domain-containing protein [Thiomicrorhabdus sp. 6S3-12]MBO1923294.1 TIM44-like domain-containing protein [Thiomicrorhabdus sp. 6S3-12]
MSTSGTRFWLVMISVFALLFAISQTAEAKRLGSSKSLGYSKQITPKSYTQKSTTDSKTTQTAGTTAGAAAGTTAAKSGAAKWLGPLAGLAVGGLLAAMIFGDAFEGIQILDILLFALIAFILFQMFARKKQQAQQEPVYESYQRDQYQPQQPAQPESSMQTQQRDSHAPYDPNAGGSIIGSGLSGEAPSDKAQPVTEMPEWFNEQGFIEAAKDHFIALQKAWDDVDMAALESYCTPELFKALSEELEGVQPGDNQTGVDSVYAEIADKVIEDNYFIVSVRYSGFIEESAGEGAHAFSEVWHIRRLQEGEGNWQVAGIQQETR